MVNPYGASSSSDPKRQRNNKERGLPPVVLDSSHAIVAQPRATYLTLAADGPKSSSVNTASKVPLYLNTAAPRPTDTQIVSHAHSSPTINPNTRPFDLNLPAPYETP